MTTFDISRHHDTKMVGFSLPRHAYILRDQQRITLHITDHPNPPMPIVFRTSKSAENGRRNMANNMPMRRTSMENWSVRPVYIRPAVESEDSKNILVMFDWKDIDHKIDFEDDMVMAEAVKKVVIVDSN